MERVAPYKQMEGRILKMKNELEQRYKNDLANEITRLREFEVSRIRMEEAAKYRDKMEAFRTEMEQMHLEKVKELKLREQQALERIKARDMEVEKSAYEHRQKVLKDEELMRYRENDIKKTVEMELYLVKAEKDRMAKTIHDYEVKIGDMEQFKLRIEK
jgi:oral-facial-digital syndrome 1 protein